MKIITIVGARPQFIKAAVLSRILRRKKEIQEILVHTGQHFDANMSEIFFQQMEIPEPDFFLEIAALNHGAMTGRMLEKIEQVLLSEKPDRVLVYGDTNSTLAGALAAVKLQIPIAHVESGLRSYNKAMPEEINRILTDHAADLLLTPTDRATQNLLEEGIDPGRIEQVGDVMFDAMIFYGAKSEKYSQILSKYGLERGNYILSTIHRQENTDDPKRLHAIFKALNDVGKEFSVVLPLHPRTHKCLKEAGLLKLTEGLTVLPPLGYLDMIMLERGAAVIATDSGGVQKEAYFNGVPSVTLRNETEWVELVTLGWNRLAPPGSADIVKEIISAIKTKGKDSKPYGDGKAAELIANKLLTGN